ncbi:MAG: hypothetical protein IKM29_00825 [Clostridia bacterium]|nr:hypothetical protein [Clostridia bacterium]
MKKTRLLALVLALVMVVTLFAACGNTEPEETTAATTEATTEATTTAATTAAPAKIDQGGRTVQIASAFFNDYVPKVGESAFHDAWQQVYDDLEEEINVQIEWIGGPHEMAEALPSIMGGDFDALGDIGNGKPLYWIPLAVNGYIAQLNTDEMAALGLNINDENAFFQPFTKAMNLNGAIYAASWNGPYHSCEFGWAMFVNLDYVAQYGGVDDIFQVVRDMDWTWEKFLDLQEKCAQDTDGDGNIDIWGSGEHSYGQEIYTIPGGATVYYDEATGKYLSGLTRPETQEALQFAQDYFNSGYCETETGYGDIHKKFVAGESAMQWGEQWNTAKGSYFDGVSINYGIIPIPKHEDATTYTNVLGGVKCYFLFPANTEFEQNAVVMQKLGEAFTDYDTVWESFLNENANGNEQSVEMVTEYIWGQYSTTVTDYSWAAWTELQQWYRDNVYFPIVTENKSVVETITAQDAAFQAAVDAVFGQ